jgi:hypothetical protein
MRRILIFDSLWCAACPAIQTDVEGTAPVRNVNKLLPDYMVPHRQSRILHSNRRENLKSYIACFMITVVRISRH